MSKDEAHELIALTIREILKRDYIADANAKLIAAAIDHILDLVDDDDEEEP